MLLVSTFCLDFDFFSCLFGFCAIDLKHQFGFVRLYFVWDDFFVVMWIVIVSEKNWMWRNHSNLVVRLAWKLLLCLNLDLVWHCGNETTVRYNQQSNSKYCDLRESKKRFCEDHVVAELNQRLAASNRLVQAKNVAFLLVYSSIQWRSPFRQSISALKWASCDHEIPFYA